MAWHNETGKTGEKLAADWLEKKGFTILEKNWRNKRLEVDIIAEKDNLLHFIEVKSRSSQNYGLPEESVSLKKIENLLNASVEYLNRYPTQKRIQFDVLAITMQKDNAKYFFIEDVYL